jgi:SAM-dependent methyltransferase
MPPETLDFGRRSQLTELMDEPSSRAEMRACLEDLAKVNRWLLGYRPLLAWFTSLALPPRAKPIHIVDVGSGYGDSLRRIEKWASQHAVAVELTGLDLNPDAVAIAAEASPTASNIEWICRDVFAYVPDNPIDIVISSLFTHHLSDGDVVRFLRWMEAHSRLGWFINDLSRNAVPYYSFKLFAKVTGMHPFVQHDGPVSVARAFVPSDWQTMCAAAGINNRDVAIQGYTPGRLCVGRRKPQ